jgi:osmoprotectant transport system ATP-binding protein
MLMDEPFGAIDPITRDRLQNEFLRLQAELRKTIVFVTHDIDEAIKMGDRIAILGERSRIAQLDTPERILAFPVDDFVDDFIGNGATLKGLNFERVRDLDLEPYPAVSVDHDRSAARQVARDAEQKYILVTDRKGRPIRWVQERHLERTDRPLSELGPGWWPRSSPTPPCTTPWRRCSAPRWGPAASSTRTGASSAWSRWRA